MVRAEEITNFIGAAGAIAYFASTIALFALRLSSRLRAASRLGLIQTVLMGMVTIILLGSACLFHRPFLYFLQVGLMSLFLLVELLLDFILRLDFRRRKWAVIGYVILFFAGTGGMLGVAARAGQAWILPAAVLFIGMSVLAFVQRVKGVDDRPNIETKLLPASRR